MPPRYMQCSHCCATSADLSLCGKCFSTAYCNRSCQKAAWSAGHKDICCTLTPAERSSLQLKMCLSNIWAQNYSPEDRHRQAVRVDKWLRKSPDLRSYALLFANGGVDESLGEGAYGVRRTAALLLMNAQDWPLAVTNRRADVARRNIDMQEYEHFYGEPSRRFARAT